VSSHLYKPSLRRFPKTLPEPNYPHHDMVKHVTSSGYVYFRNEKTFFLSSAIAGQSIGLEEEQDSIWRINFMDLDLGFLDEQTMKFTPISPEESFQRISSPSRENS
jgi:hypothetical protein